MRYLFLNCRRWGATTSRDGCEKSPLSLFFLLIRSSVIIVLCRYFRPFDTRQLKLDSNLLKTRHLPISNSGPLRTIKTRSPVLYKSPALLIEFRASFDLFTCVVTGPRPVLITVLDFKIVFYLPK